MVVKAKERVGRVEELWVEDHLDSVRAVVEELEMERIFLKREPKYLFLN